MGELWEFQEIHSGKYGRNSDEFKLKFKLYEKMKHKNN